MPLVFVVGLSNCSKEDYVGRSNPQEAAPRSHIISQPLGNNPGCENATIRFNEYGYRITCLQNNDNYFLHRKNLQNKLNWENVSFYDDSNREGYQIDGHVDYMAFNQEPEKMVYKRGENNFEVYFSGTRINPEKITPEEVDALYADKLSYLNQEAVEEFWHDWLANSN